MSTALLHHILSKRAAVAPLSAGMPPTAPAPAIPLKPMGADEKAALFMPRRSTPVTTSAIQPSGVPRQP
jgi:hypothetical protein